MHWLICFLDTITDYKLTVMIWERLYKMVLILLKDPHPKGCTVDALYYVWAIQNWLRRITSMVKLVDYSLVHELSSFSCYYISV